MKCVMRLSNDFHCLPRQVLTGRNDAKITMNRLQQSAMISNELSVYIYIYIIIVKNQTTDVELQCHTLLEYLFASISPVFVVNPILGHLTDINSI